MNKEFNGVFTDEMIENMRKLLSREPPPCDTPITIEKKKLIDKTPEERQMESLRLIKKWERK